MLEVNKCLLILFFSLISSWQRLTCKLKLGWDYMNAGVVHSDHTEYSHSKRDQRYLQLPTYMLDNHGKGG